MKLQSAGVLLQNFPPPTRFPPRQFQTHHGNHTGLKRQTPGLKAELHSLVPSSRSGVFLRDVNSNLKRKVSFRIYARRSSEPLGGKSGSVSFGGLSHQTVEESKLVSTPYEEENGSLLWVLAPVALVSSLIVPQFFIVGAIEDAFKNEVFAEILSSLSCEVIFYAGVAMFLFVTERVQRPYLQFSPKRWSLITGLKGYLSSAFVVAGIKFIVPIIAVYVTWPELGFTALVSVAPFLAGCLAQYAFEKCLDKNGSSCWPLLPIIFEVYRIYQLTRAMIFIDKLLSGMSEAAVTPAVMDRAGALISMMVTFRALGVVCLWALLTFLLRLFPSRPVAENY